MALSINSTIGELMADEGAKAILEKRRPGSTTGPENPQAMGMTLKQVAPYLQPPLTDDELKALDEELGKL